MQLKPLFLGLAALLIAACNPVEVMKDADAEVEQFQASFEAGDLESIWRTTHPEFRKIVTKAQFSTMLTDFRELLGEIESTKRENFNVNTNNGTTTATIVMRTQFANGEGLETFGYREQGERMLLVNYAVQSPVLDDYDFSKLEGEGLIYETPPETPE